MTTWSFPLPKTSQLQEVEKSEKSDGLARCARFTQRATWTTQPQSDGSSEWKIRCPMRTCDGDDQVHHGHLSNIATQIASCGSDKEGRGIDNKNTSDGTRRANSSDCSTRYQEQETRTSWHTPRMQKKRSCERCGGQDMKLNNTCAPAAFDSWRLRSRRPAAAMVAWSQRKIKKQEKNNVTVLRDYKASLSWTCSSCPALPAPPSAAQ